MNKLITLFLLLFYFTLSNAQSFKVIGYFPTYRLDFIDSLEFDKLTHINISFANPGENADLETDNVDITPIVVKAKQHKVKVFISLGGGAINSVYWTNWQKYLSADFRSLFIHKIIEYIDIQKLDGVDMDLEWNRVNDDYSPFVIELKDSLKAQNLELTAAFPGTFRYPEISEQALACFDFINLMAYDLTGPWEPSNIGNHSPYSFAQQSIIYWKGEGVSKERLVLGVPFYGYDFGNSTVSAFTYKNMVRRDINNAYQDQVDNAYYNGIPTIRAKTALAMESASGIMIWEIGYDTYNDLQKYSLLNAIYEELHGIPAAVDVNLDNVFTIFPNPANDYIQIRFPDKSQVIKEISVVGISGVILKQAKLPLNGEIVLNISDLQKGLYFINMVSENKRIVSKVVKL